MKRVVLLLFTVLAWFAARAQGDSILTLLETATPDTQYLTRIEGFPMNWTSRRTAERSLQALRHHIQGLERSKDPAVRERLEHARLYALFLEGSLHGLESDYAQAAMVFNEAGRAAADLHDTAALVRYEEHLSNLYRQIGDTANAVTHGNRGTDLALSIGDSTTAFNILYELARYDEDRLEQVLALADEWRTEGPLGPQYYWWRGWVLTAHGRHDEAIRELLRSDTLLQREAPHGRWLNYWTLGEVYRAVGRTKEAISALDHCLSEVAAMKNGVGGWDAGCACDLGGEYLKLGDEAKAEQAFRRSIDIARSTKQLKFELSSLERLKDLLIRQRRTEEALEVTRDWLVLRDSTERMDATKDLMRSEFAAEQRADSLMNAQQRAATTYQLQRERNNRNLILAAGMVAILFGAISYHQRRRTQTALKRSDELLLNILPDEVAEELKAKGHADAKHFDNVTILFTDFKGFTEASEKLSPQELVEELNTCFKAFDGIITARGIEKIKTIGDAYMCAGGLPVPSSSTPAGVVQAALEMQAFIIARKKERDVQGKPAFEMRVGIHTGPVVAGIVGVKKFAYDIWGDTVNTASRMESSGEVGEVNISEATYVLVKDIVVSSQLSGSPPTVNRRLTTPAFTFTPRGKVQAKGKGELEMYFVTGKPAVAKGYDG